MCPTVGTTLALLYPERQNILFPVALTGMFGNGIVRSDTKWFLLAGCDPFTSLPYWLVACGLWPVAPLSAQTLSYDPPGQPVVRNYGDVVGDYVVGPVT